ncbi:MAG: SRPBCC family protein [Microcystis sp. M015S2]|jgi:ribosome-associated toxin RatA of RatAB toxin-antitoxin module|uniref:SRPBCC family protein n=1 Tax=unclassified Microcystis TaxID=2643300 RepID=UPI0022C95781|nr:MULTISPECIES: SRPBCC family protein [unclassified Microcystis]MCZ8306431.1 SRPBCC family protein [Microcystis sp. LE19-98.1E]MCA2693156.1 SRPBCC family protein [Microcystis sp. M034S2]MCA2711298.1 SRPBCC family protein [Microcystis sp. M025S2]MCA2743595.1 SRPBCC family protein [Microcystis sp. M015S2]MCA2751395.1 SRPBCC family protein [Microcystis sp. M144S2]
MISESVTVHRSLAAVFNAFADLENWKRVLPDVLGVDILYDDGCHQEFLMTVERPKGAEMIRGIRFCQPNDHIELFQPVPPPGFQSMTGRWTFQEQQDKVTVTAERWFTLAPNNDLNDEEMGEKLRCYLRHNLGLFQASLERGA